MKMRTRRRVTAHSLRRRVNAKFASLENAWDALANANINGVERSIRIFWLMPVLRDDSSIVRIDGATA